MIRIKIIIAIAMFSFFIVSSYIVFKVKRYFYNKKEKDYLGNVLIKKGQHSLEEINVYLKRIIENLQEIDEFKNVEEKLNRNNVSITFINEPLFDGSSRVAGLYYPEMNSIFIEDISKDLTETAYAHELLHHVFFIYKKSIKQSHSTYFYAILEIIKK